MADNTIFDDVFRTMLEKMPELVIPLINEVFGKNYPADIPIVQMRNEHQTQSGEIITDSRLLIADKIYHIECQSTSDSKMVLRMIEYDFAIGLEDAKMENGIYRMYFPHSCVIYLRGKGRKDNLTLEIIMPDGQTLKYSLPAVYVEKYTRDTIFQKKLFLLLPYYIMRYEKQKEILDQDEEKLKILLDEYADIQRKLHESLHNQDMEEYYTDMVSFITKVSDYIFRDSEKTKKGLEKTMGGEVLELESEKLIRKGRQQGIQQGMQQGIQTNTAETVIRMRNTGKFTEEDISLATGLGLEAIRKIK